MSHHRLSTPPPSEALSQYQRCLDRLRAAKQAGLDPAPYLTQAQQWLAIVQLTDPAAARALAAELEPAAAAAPPAQLATLPSENQPPAWRDPRLLLARLAWVGVPFAILFMIVGGNMVIQILAGVCLVCLLALIFLD